MGPVCQGVAGRSRTSMESCRYNIPPLASVERREKAGPVSLVTGECGTLRVVDAGGCGPKM
jgi:hypothetical protein